MKTQILKNLTEEEIFRVQKLLNFGFTADTILSELGSDHQQNSRVLSLYDGSASMMYDCYVDTHQDYLGSKGKLPYQVWNSFVKKFNEWLKTRTNLVCYRQVIHELILVNEDYREYFQNVRKELREQDLKYILQQIENRNQELQDEVNDYENTECEDLPF